MENDRKKISQDALTALGSFIDLSIGELLIREYADKHQGNPVALAEATELAGALSARGGIRYFNLAERELMRKVTRDLFPNSAKNRGWIRL